AGMAAACAADVLGADAGEMRPRPRPRAARVAMDDRDRRAPITLARDAPVAKPPDGGALAPAAGLGLGDDRADPVLGGEAVEEAAIHQAPGADIGLVADRIRGFFRGGGDDAGHRKAVFT